MTSCAASGETGPQRLAAMNQSCLCLPLNRSDIDAGILRNHPVPGMAQLLNDRPHLFAGTPVFLAEVHVSSILEQIEAIEAATRLCSYRAAALPASNAPLNDAQPRTKGLMMGYDFHITPNGPRLIEVNTNAGGAFLVAAMYRAIGDSDAGSNSRLLETFLSEWRGSRRSLKPETLAIIDHLPHEQYLYPDMLLARSALEEAGIRTVIADPSDLSLEDGKLKLGGLVIDMVYNRLTDFDFSDAASNVLRRALLEDAAIISPAPRHHALHADKRNLALLSNPDWREQTGLPSHHLSALAAIPETICVTEENADELWARRRNLFFKPASGFGGRAAYRGSKLTRKVWSDILSGTYVAQTYVPPTYRAVTIDSQPGELKYDLRIYTYDAAPLLFAARVYQGQTTNFRSAGGGFAPVIIENASGD